MIALEAKSSVEFQEGSAINQVQEAVKNLDKKAVGDKIANQNPIPEKTETEAKQYKLNFPQLQPGQKINDLQETPPEKPDYLPEEHLINAGIKLINEKIGTEDGIKIPKEKLTIIKDKLKGLETDETKKEAITEDVAQAKLQEVMRGIMTGDKAVRTTNVKIFQQIGIDFYPGKKTSGDGSFGPNTLFAMLNAVDMIPKDRKEGDKTKTDNFNVTMNKILDEINSKKQPTDKKFSRNEQQTIK